jgi:bifunctional DNA-binding transcriptional regulator/antitoxin component of YhaV-PrlF toxin-antitoxin module
MKATVTINSRGIITLTAKLRRALHLEADDQLIAEITRERERELERCGVGTWCLFPQENIESQTNRSRRAVAWPLNVRHAKAVRVFLGANILFSAAKSDGAVRQLLHVGSAQAIDAIKPEASSPSGKFFRIVQCT